MKPMNPSPEEISAAARAQEIYGDDELEEFAALLRASGKTPQIEVGVKDDLTELIED